MSFSDKDRQALIELINNIQHSFFSADAPAGGDARHLALPCRLVRLAAEVLEESYQPGVVGRLDEAEVALLVTYLSKAVESVAGSLRKVVSALPAGTPAALLARFDSGAGSVEAIREEHASLFAAADSLLGREAEILDRKRQLDELRARQQSLAEAQEQLRLANFESLRAEVARLEAEAGPARAELGRLRREVAERGGEAEAVGRALAEARRRLDTLDRGTAELAAGLQSLFDDLLGALGPYLSRCEKGLERAAQAIAEKLAEGLQLEQQLSARIADVNRACEDVARLAAATKLYAEADHEVARNVPTVISITREKLIRIEEQLQEIDGELRLALERHQEARHVADASRPGG